jgi:hypothetical protein
MIHAHLSYYTNDIQKKLRELHHIACYINRAILYSTSNDVVPIGEQVPSSTGGQVKISADPFYI